MDQIELDRVAGRELDGVLKDLRADKQKLTDENKAAKNKASWGWMVAAFVAFAWLLMMCGDHVHRY